MISSKEGKTTKGQLISKCLFGVFTFFQKRNENKLISSKVGYVRSFSGRNVGLKKWFGICLTFKGQLILKQNCRAVTSPKKQMKCTQDSILSVFCSFFGRSYGSTILFLVTFRWEDFAHHITSYPPRFPSDVFVAAKLVRKY